MTEAWMVRSIQSRSVKRNTWGWEVASTTSCNEALQLWGLQRQDVALWSPHCRALLTFFDVGDHQSKIRTCSWNSFAGWDDDSSKGTFRSILEKLQERWWGESQILNWHFRTNLRNRSRTVWWGPQYRKWCTLQARSELLLQVTTWFEVFPSWRYTFLQAWLHSEVGQARCLEELQ